MVQQLNGKWSCRAQHLQSFYEHGIELIQRIRNTPEINEFNIAHIYREYNADADSAANEGIDHRSRAVIGTQCVINQNWEPMILADDQECALRSPLLSPNDNTSFPSISPTTDVEVAEDASPLRDEEGDMLMDYLL